MSEECLNCKSIFLDKCKCKHLYNCFACNLTTHVNTDDVNELCNDISICELCDTIDHSSTGCIKIVHDKIEKTKKQKESDELPDMVCDRILHKNKCKCGKQLLKCVYCERYAQQCYNCGFNFHLYRKSQFDSFYLDYCYRCL